MSAQEAEKAGLVSKVFPPGELVDEAVKLGEKIAGFSKIATVMAKEAVNAANNLTLDEGTYFPCPHSHISTVMTLDEGQPSYMYINVSW